MRVVFLATQDLESPSMLGRWWPLACELARLGHKITIYTLHSKYKKNNVNVFTRNGVNVHYLAPMHVWKEGNVKGYYPTYKLIKLAFEATLRQARAVMTTPADIIYICKPHPMNSMAGIVGKLLRRHKLFLDCDDYEAAIGHFTRNWQRQGIAMFEKFMPSQANLITTNTFFMRDKLRSWGVPENKIIYLSNGVDRSRFSRPPDSLIDNLRAQWGLNGRDVVAYIGSLSLANHPVDLLLEAFALLHTRVNKVVLLLVGGGEDFDRLKSQALSLGIEEKVKFCGRIPPDKVSAYYYLADVTVDPVRDDNGARGRSPLKLFESWACGIPFVTSDVGDRRRLLGDPPAGALAKPGDPDSLCSTIAQVLTSPALKQSLSYYGTQRVRHYFWDKLVLSLEQFYLSNS